jgi:hypothetical protein
MFSFRKKLPLILAFAAALLISAVAINAQTETARLTGNVTDAAGAVIAGATVKITNLGTNRTADTNTNAEGAFSFLGLQPGRYLLEVSQTNFKTLKREITLEVAQALNLTDIALEAGSVSEIVTVTTETPLVETSSSAIGNVVDGRQAVELPLNGRNVLELARLSPGVTQGVVGGFATGANGDAETYRGRNTGGAALSVNGQRTQANNFLLDGVDNNESLVNTINIFPSAEAVQEFRVQTSVAPAEFGRGGGAIVNSVVKSGTNLLHGSSYLFIRNSALDARPAFFPATPKKRLPDFRRGQFGATVGGPVFLPGIGEGVPIINRLQNRVFFFFSYDGLRQFLPTSTDTATVPTLAFRNGDFSALLNPAISGLSAPIQLRDPLTNAPIPGNRLDLLPGNRLNQAALNYLRAFPLPNNGNQVLGNYINTRNEVDKQNVFDFRIDGTINNANQIFVRTSIGRYAQTVGTRLTTLPSGFGSGSNPTRNYGVVVGVNSGLRSNLFNELRLQVNRLSYGYEPPFGDQPISARLGIVNANRDSSLGGGALIGGYNEQLEYTGDYGAYRVPQKTYQIVDSISYTTGRNIFKFGGTVLRRDVELFRPIAGKGYFRIYGNGDFSQCPGPGAAGAPSLAASGTTGFEQADLLIGFMCGYQIGTQVGKILTRNYENAAFVQDDLRATDKLTLNLGLRYEYFTNPAEVSGKQSNFDLKTGRLVVASKGGDAQVKTDKNNFGPRVGFAYDLFGKGKSVIRGGYGLFYFLDRGGINNQLAQNAPFAGSVSYSYNDGYRITLSGQGPLGNNDNRAATQPLPLPSVIINQAFLNNPVGADILAIKPDNKISNVQQFNVQFQQQLTGNTAVSVGYVGTRGRNLILYYNLQNGRIVTPGAAIPCPIAGRTLGNCYPGLSSVTVRDDIGKSSYNSLQVQLERRFSKGWQYILSYTLSKTKDNGEGAFDNVAGGLNYIQPFANSRLDYPHVFSYQTVYEIPFGRGRQFGSNIPRALDAIVGGFQLNAIYRIQSGNPFDVRKNDALVNLVGNPYTGSTTGRYLNFSAFQPAPAGTVGNLGRNSLRSPTTNQLNLGLTKNFALYERLRLQFRAEAFNIFNTTQLGTPNTNLDDYNAAISNTNATSGFGTIRNISPFTNRQLQFGLRLEF